MFRCSPTVPQSASASSLSASARIGTTITVRAPGIRSASAGLSGISLAPIFFPHPPRTLFQGRAFITHGHNWWCLSPCHAHPMAQGMDSTTADRRERTPFRAQSMVQQYRSSRSCRARTMACAAITKASGPAKRTAMALGGVLDRSSLWPACRQFSLGNRAYPLAKVRQRSQIGICPGSPGAGPSQNSMAASWVLVEESTAPLRVDRFSVTCVCTATKLLSRGTNQ
jgi:hypothetical protein